MVLADHDGLRCGIHLLCALQILLTMLESSRKANESLLVEMVHLKQLADLQKADMECREGDLKSQVEQGCICLDHCNCYWLDAVHTFGCSPRDCRRTPKHWLYEMKTCVREAEFTISFLPVWLLWTVFICGHLQNGCEAMADSPLVLVMAC